jgi:hypothetical protein
MGARPSRLFDTDRVSAVRAALFCILPSPRILPSADNCSPSSARQPHPVPSGRAFAVHGFVAHDLRGYIGEMKAERVEIETNVSV